jgi:hypothetical protein
LSPSPPETPEPPRLAIKVKQPQKTKNAANAMVIAIKKPNVEKEDKKPAEVVVLQGEVPASAATVEEPSMKPITPKPETPKPPTPQEVAKSEPKPEPVKKVEKKSAKKTDKKRKRDDSSDEDKEDDLDDLDNILDDFYDDEKPSKKKKDKKVSVCVIDSPCYRKRRE